MKRMDDNSIDAIITDPPYGISMMNQKWDYNIPSVAIWQEALRILKPGAHILVACGTRTQHRMACNIEDAGFEIRDTIVWCYSTGFPKSLDISKALGKELGEEREIGVVKTRPDGTTRHNTQKHAGNTFMCGSNDKTTSSPSSPIAHTYNGYGTALKPAFEAFTLARKKISEKNIALNVIKYGTGGINVDGCRVETNEQWKSQTTNSPPSNTYHGGIDGYFNKQRSPSHNMGRFPANLIHDGSDEVVGLFPNTGKSQGGRSGHTGIHGGGWKQEHYGDEKPGYGDSGSAARYFHSTMTPNNTSRDNAIQFSQSKHQFNYGPESNTSAARFFYTPKASRKEKNQGLNNTLSCISITTKELSLCQEENMVAAQLLKMVILDLEITNLNIDVYGNYITVNCPTECVSTISMEINKIIESKILNLLIASLTNEFTAVVNSETEIGGNPVENVENLRKFLVNTTNGSTELALGASNVVLKTLLKIKEKENWRINNNFHATVKPLALMQYLVRLISPPTAIILDPFMGSGTTGIATITEGHSFIGCELDPHYHNIAQQRIKHAQQQQSSQYTLFN